MLRGPAVARPTAARATAQKQLVHGQRKPEPELVRESSRLTVLVELGARGVTGTRHKPGLCLVIGKMKRDEAPALGVRADGCALVRVLPELGAIDARGAQVGTKRSGCFSYPELHVKHLVTHLGTAAPLLVS